jgi:hypothetical protein
MISMQTNARMSASTNEGAARLQAVQQRQHDRAGECLFLLIPAVVQNSMSTWEMLIQEDGPFSNGTE